MNEQIAKFANESGFDVDKTGTFGNYSEIHRLEKFAELIVQRTLAIVEAHTEIFQSSEARAMVEHIKQSVKTDFGVEE